jgi:hypothetical protein
MEPELKVKNIQETKKFLQFAYELLKPRPLDFSALLYFNLISLIAMNQAII